MIEFFDFEEKEEVSGSKRSRREIEERNESIEGEDFEVILNPKNAPIDW